MGLQRQLGARPGKQLTKNSLFFYSISFKQFCRIWLHPRDQKCSVLCRWPFSGRQHRQEALQGPPSGPTGWLQHSRHWIHWRPKGEGGQCQESQSQAVPVTWQMEMIAKGFLLTFGGLGICHQIGATTLNAARLLLDYRMAMTAPSILVSLLSCWVIFMHKKCQARPILGRPFS